MLEDPHRYWQIELWLDGLYMEFGIDQPKHQSLKDKIPEEDWGGGESDPGWIDQLPVA